MSLIDGLMGKLISSGRKAVQTAVEGDIVGALTENPILLSIGLGILVLLVDGKTEPKASSAPQRQQPVIINNYYQPYQQPKLKAGAPQKTVRRTK